jgi:hypothetical protein
MSLCVFDKVTFNGFELTIETPLESYEPYPDQYHANAKGNDGLYYGLLIDEDKETILDMARLT